MHRNDMSCVSVDLPRPLWVRTHCRSGGVGRRSREPKTEGRRLGLARRPGVASLPTEKGPTAVTEGVLGGCPDTTPAGGVECAQEV